MFTLYVAIEIKGTKGTNFSYFVNENFFLILGGVVIPEEN